MALSCGMKCVKYFLFAFNIVLWLMGAALLAAGIYILVEPNASNLLNLMNQVSVSSAGFDLAGLLKSACYVLIAFGAFLFIVGFLGCCGAIKESKCLLATYAAIVGICLLMEIVAAVLAAVFWKEANSKLKSSLLKVLQDNYNGFNGTHVPTSDASSLLFDYVQSQLECCGVNGSSDFSGATKWVKNGNTIPPICCKLNDKTKFPDITLASSTCPTAPTTTNSFKDTGCYQTIIDKITQYAQIVIGVGAGVGALQIFVIIGACCLCKRIGDGDMRNAAKA